MSIQLGVGPKSTSSLIKSNSTFTIDKLISSGISIGTTLYVGSDTVINGNLTCNGTQILIDTETTIVKEALQKQADDNISDTLDIGTYAKYIESGVTKYTGFFRDSTDKIYKLFHGLETEPTTTVNIDSSYQKSKLELGDLEVENINFTGNLTNNNNALFVNQISDNDLSTKIETNNENLTFITNSSEKMRIKDDGNIGIGLDNPNYKLDISGDINFTGNLFNNGVTIFSNTQFNLIKDNDNTTSISTNDIPETLTFNTNNSEKLRITTDGNVGIGITNPTEKLEVDGNIITTGTIRSQAPGQILNVLMINNPTSTNTSFNSGSYTEVMSYSYTPVSNNSKISIYYQNSFVIGSGGNCGFRFNIEVDDTEICETYHYCHSEGLRSAGGLPIKQVYTNISTNPLIITINCRRSSGDDTLSTLDNSFFEIMEISN